jgi:streptogramin lyase
VTVIGPAGTVVGSVQLTGINPQAGVVSGNRLYVIDAGHFGQGDGSLSVVNLASGTQEVNAAGFGEFPGSIDVGPDGNVYVGLYGKGILVWNPGTRQFVRGQDNPIVPGGAPPVSALAFDHLGRLHALNPGSCGAAGKEYRLDPSAFTVNRTVTTGVCPFSIAFAELIPVD